MTLFSLRSIVVATALVTFLCGGVLSAAPDDLGRYDQALQKLAKRVKPSIVTVRVVALSASEAQTSTLQEMNRRVLYRASGMITESKGEVVTVFGSGLWEYDLDPKERLGLEVELHDGEIQIAELIAHDQDTGIALMSLENAPKLRAVRYAKRLPQQGSTVISVGADGFAKGVVAHPARGIAHKGASLPRGIVTTIEAQPGDVGGMLVNVKGELVGILAFSLLGPASGQGETDEVPEQLRGSQKNGRVAKNPGVYDRERRPDFGEFGAAKVTVPRAGGPLGRSVAIPVDLLVHIVTALREDGAMVRGALGATFQFHHPAFTENSHIGVGARVCELVEDGTAKAAGLRIDDVIQKVEGRAVKRPEDLLWFRERVEYGEIGRKISLMVARLERGRIVSKKIQVPIGVRPEGSRGDGLEDPPEEPDCEGGVTRPVPGPTGDCPPAPSSDETAPVESGAGAPE